MVKILVSKESVASVISSFRVLTSKLISFQINKGSLSQETGATCHLSVRKDFQPLPSKRKRSLKPSYPTKPFFLQFIIPVTQGLRVGVASTLPRVGGIDLLPLFTLAIENSFFSSI